MSENNIQNEQELWDVLDGKAPAEPATAPKAEPRAVKSEAKFAKADAPKGKVDSFFLTCMAGVAAVSVAATLLVTSLVGGEPAKTNPVSNETTPAVGGETVSGESSSDSDLVAALELENSDLRAQVEAQKEQIKKLQAELLDLTGGEETPVLSTGDGETNELTGEQVMVYELFKEIQTAYADFDREKLEELIPQMDQYISKGYLSNDALYEYYMILEYVESPSNG